MTAGAFDLAVIDLDLPDGVGTQLAERLRQEGRLGPVIFFTSTNDHRLKEAAEVQGRVIHKESGIDELMVWVRREFRQRERLARVAGEEFSVTQPGTGTSGTRKRVP